MIKLVDILRQEDENEGNVYFHNIDGHWYAFEHSAFVATLMFNKQEMHIGMYPWTENEQTIHLPMVEIKPHLLFTQKLAYASDTEAKLPFHIRVGKLKWWKASMRKKYAK